MEKVLEYVDLLLYDIKHMNSDAHEEGTGKDNLLILDNVRKSTAKVDTWIRVPVIPGYNDTEQNLRKLGEFAKEVGPKKVSLLPHVEWGKQKYQRLGREYQGESIKPPDERKLKWMKGILEGFDLEVSTGK